MVEVIVRGRNAFCTKAISRARVSTAQPSPFAAKFLASRPNPTPSAAPPTCDGKTPSQQLLLELAMRSRRHAAMVGAQQSAEMFATNDTAVAMAAVVDRRDQSVSQRLVISLAGIMKSVSTKGAVERCRAAR